MEHGQIKGSCMPRNCECEKQVQRCWYYHEGIAKKFIRRSASTRKTQMLFYGIHDLKNFLWMQQCLILSHYFSSERRLPPPVELTDSEEMSIVARWMIHRGRALCTPLFQVVPWDCVRLLWVYFGKRNRDRLGDVICSSKKWFSTGSSRRIAEEREQFLCWHYWWWSKLLSWRKRESIM